MKRFNQKSKNTIYKCNRTVYNKIKSKYVCSLSKATLNAALCSGNMSSCDHSVNYVCKHGKEFGFELDDLWQWCHWSVCWSEAIIRCDAGAPAPSTVFVFRAIVCVCRVCVIQALWLSSV